MLTVEFTVMDIPCLGLNGGPAFKHNEAFSFQIATADRAETDRYWNAIVGNGGQESRCNRCTDEWGLSWRITPVVLTKAITDPDPVAAHLAIMAEVGAAEWKEHYQVYLSSLPFSRSAILDGWHEVSSTSKRHLTGRVFRSEVSDEVNVETLRERLCSVDRVSRR